MSIQDESFPHDDYFEEQNFSLQNKTPLRFQFPDLHRRLQQFERKDGSSSKQSLKNPQPQPQLQPDEAQLPKENVAHIENFNSNHNVSKTDNSNSFNDDDNQNLSSETSSNDRPLSIISGKTTVSDQTGYEEENKKAHFDAAPVSKAISCQNVHSEYTKRRFKHIQSKVGLYIANMKAEDQRRRDAVPENQTGKFQRYKSLPETFPIETQQSDNNPRKRCSAIVKGVNSNHFSAIELHKLNDGFTSYLEENLSEIMPGTIATTTTTTSSSEGGSHHHHHECSDETAATNSTCAYRRGYVDLMDEKDRIESYSDYLQTRLQEKSDENLRLKQNMDYLRLELTNCQDKLKRQMSTQRSFSSSSFSSGNVSTSGLGRQSLQSLLFAQARTAKATQTEISAPPTVPATPIQLMSHNTIYSTPNVDNVFKNATSTVPASCLNICSNNSSEALGGNSASMRNVPTIQPMSLNFSNIAGSSKDGSHSSVLRFRNNSMLHQQNAIMVANAEETGNITTRTSCPSSSDSAIDIQPVSPRVMHVIRPSVSQQLLDDNEFVYYDGHSGRYATIDAVNIQMGSSSDLVECELRRWNHNDSTDDEDNGTTGRSVTTRSDTTASTDTARFRKKRNSIRRRWMRFFAHCGRCTEANQSAVLETSGQTQLPLLEKSAE